MRREGRQDKEGEGGVRRYIEMGCDLGCEKGGGDGSVRREGELV